ncbi:MAG: DUF885 domain-containing protein [Pseudomonadota bacterium]
MMITPVLSIFRRVAVIPYRVSLALLTAATFAGTGCSRQDSAEQMPASAQTELAAPTATDAMSQLDTLIEQFVESQSDSDQEIGLRPVTAEAFEAEIDEMRTLLAAVRAVDPAGLSFEASIDQRVLIGMLDTDAFAASDRRLWEIDPSIYVPAGQVGRLLEPESIQSPAERAEALAAVLADIPEHVRQARINLKNPPQRFTESAIFKTAGTIKSLTEDASTLATDAPAGVDAFNDALREAIEALESFQAYLETELLPAANGSWAVGKNHYDYILKNRWFFDLDADDILARGQSGFAETEALAQQVANRIEPGKHWAEVYETLKDDHPPIDGIKAAYQASIDEAQVFIRENQIVTLPDGERVVTLDTPPAMRRSSPFGTFQSVDRFGTDLEGKLLLTPIEGWMSESQQAERVRSHHNAWIPVIAVHEAYPGHHTDALKTRENPRLLRKVVGESIFAEGWGLFTEELMYELGFLQGDDVRLTQLRNRLWRAARVILDVSLHTGRMTFDEAVDFLVEKVRFERYAAELEVGMYTERPTFVLGYLIGMQEIIDIRADWIARYGEPDPPSEFYDALLRIGSIPPVLVRESLLARDEPPSAQADGP